MKFDLEKFKLLVGLLAPAVLIAIPHGDQIAPFIPKVTAAITEAEAIEGATGAEKKAHVLNILRTSVEVGNAAGKKHLDPAVVTSIAGHGIDAVIETVHAVHKVPETPGA